MSYRTPDTTISICYGVPLDNSYKNTLLFETATAQREYFQGKVLYTYDKYSYQRVGLGKIRVGQMAENLYSCNYLFFRNMDSAGSKWFYAFITDVAYINENVTEITYEIDVMQTYYFNYELGECFVEREHVIDDTIGVNVVQEQLNTGDLVCTKIKGTGKFDSYKIVLCTGYASDGTPGGIYTDMPSCLEYEIYSADSESQVESLCEYLQVLVDNQKDDAIVGLWMIPDALCGDKGSSIDDVCISVTNTMPTTIDGYKPKNNKLFTYPYNYLLVDSGEDTATYRYEWFNQYLNEGYDFKIYGLTSCVPEAVCMPIGYNMPSLGVENPSGLKVGQVNPTESITMKEFPQIAWATDAYRAWVANGGYISTGLNVLGSAGSIAGGLMTGNPYFLATGVVGIGSTLNSAVHEANKGATAHGSDNGSVGVSTRTKDFYFKCMQVQADYAESIDNYFSMYGYQINKIKVPSINGRIRWNYVKTHGCIVKSISIPADDTAKIESIFDSGITFWRYGSVEVGDYSGDNYIVGSD